MPIECRAILLGCGSSGGVPRVTGDWGAANPLDPRNHRRRCGLIVQQKPLHAPWASDQVTTLLVDTPPDMREGLLHNRITHIDATIWTHGHADQMHGIDDVRAIYHRRGSAIPAFANDETWNDALARHRYLFEGAGGYPPVYARRSALNPYQNVAIKGEGGDMAVLPVPVRHGRITNLALRFGDCVYLNDVHEISDQAAEALSGADWLIVDALRYTTHPSHAHLALALEWSERLRARHTMLTNLHIDMDYERLSAELPDHVVVATDNATVSWMQ
jgi:phosphoribosyl 1,2-cyclic phosphate phosphodiesterase